MKPGGGSLKGGEFERSICRVLTFWIDRTRKDGKPELFWRSATSGAKATQDRKAGHRKANQGGDIVAVQDEVLGIRHFWVTETFSIECKDRKDYGNLDLLFSMKGDFLNWWEQAKTDAQFGNKIPLLIFKRYRGITLIAFPSNTRSLVRSVTPSMFFWDRNQEFTINILSSWLAANDPNDMKWYAKPTRKHLGKAGK